jgi:carboxyl-terminal processing protease
MSVRITTSILVLFLIGASMSAAAQEVGVNVTIPLVEEALGFLRDKALNPRPEAAFLRAGAIRVCGKNLERAGCRPSGLAIPGDSAMGPDATRAWRLVLESALVAESIRQGAAFDKVAFQRFIMDGMVEALNDPASFYLVPSVYRKIAAIPSDFVGFGLLVVPEPDALRVSAVHSNSPASAAGLRPGDKISRVNDLPVTGYHRPLALGAIWGAEGTSVRLTLEGAKGTPRKVELVYRPWTFVPFEIERKGTVVVVRVRHFSRGLKEVFKKHLDGPLGGIVIDLRNAGSGDEEEMVGFADMLLGQGSIGSKKTRSDLGDRVWTAAPGTAGENLGAPAAVLINEGTSGLSEVFASALRINNRAILVGKITAGRDTQETMRPFGDGSAIQITSTRLFGPLETPLSAGVKPHIETDRARPDDLAVTIVQTARGPSIEELLTSGREAVDPQ